MDDGLTPRQRRNRRHRQLAPGRRAPKKETMVDRPTPEKKGKKKVSPQAAAASTPSLPQVNDFGGDDRITREIDSAAATSTPCLSQVDEDRVTCDVN